MDMVGQGRRSGTGGAVRFRARILSERIVGWHEQIALIAHHNRSPKGSLPLPPGQIYSWIRNNGHMVLVIIATTLCFLLVAAGLVAVFAKLISRDSADAAIVESDDIFSPNRYRVV